MLNLFILAAVVTSVLHHYGFFKSDKFFLGFAWQSILYSCWTAYWYIKPIFFLFVFIISSCVIVLHLLSYFTLSQFKILPFFCSCNVHIVYFMWHNSDYILCVQIHNK